MIPGYIFWNGLSLAKSNHLCPFGTETHTPAPASAPCLVGWWLLESSSLLSDDRVGSVSITYN